MEVLEVFYYCSGIIVAICAVIALIQIIISKRHLDSEKQNQRIQLERESQKYAIEQISYFTDKIIYLENEIYKKRNGNHIVFLDDKVINFEDGKLTIKFRFDKENDMDKMLEIAYEVVDVINALEVYATVLTSGLANEQFAYKIQGDAFCQTVEEYLPLIIEDKTRMSKTSSTMNLYFLWKSRLNKEKLLSEKTKLEKTLEKLSDKSISVIGMEDKSKILQ